MSIRSLQVRRTLERVIRRFLQQGDPPHAGRVASAVADEFLERGAGAPRFRPHFWSRRRPIPIDGYNEDVAALSDDFAVLFQDAAEIRNQSDRLERFLAREEAAIRSRIDALSGRIERVILQASSSESFAAWHVEDFSSLDGTDTNRSTALVDAEHRRLRLPVNTASAGIIDESDVEISAESDHKITEIAPLIYMIRPYENTAAILEIDAESDSASLLVSVKLKQAAIISRLRLYASSGPMYGLRVETISASGDRRVLHDGMVSYPLELPVNDQVQTLDLIFQLTTPVSQKNGLNRFRLVVHSLDLFQEEAIGEALWVSKPIRLPNEALHGKIDWDGNPGQTGTIDGTLDLYRPQENGSPVLMSSRPIRKGEVFSIRGDAENTLDLLGSDFAPDNAGSALPLWRRANAVPSGVAVIEPELLIGWNQWKCRTFYNEWAKQLSPDHIPHPNDWAEYAETVLSAIAYLDAGPALPVFYPSDDSGSPVMENGLVSYSCVLKSDRKQNASFSSFSISGANFSFFVNGNKIVDHTTHLAGPVRFLLKEGDNILQLYLQTRSSAATIGLDELEAEHPVTQAAERKSGVWTDGYSIRRALSQHPRLWTAMEDSDLLIRFNPSVADPVRFRLSYRSAASQDTIDAVIALRLTSKDRGISMGPCVDRLIFSVSPTGGIG